MSDASSSPERSNDPLPPTLQKKISMSNIGPRRLRERKSRMHLLKDAKDQATENGGGEEKAAETAS